MNSPLPRDRDFDSRRDRKQYRYATKKGKKGSLGSRKDLRSPLAIFLESLHDFIRCSQLAVDGVGRKFVSC